MARQDATDMDFILRPEGWTAPFRGGAPVLYAEDDRNDVFFMQMAFKKTGIANPLITVEDGVQTIDYLAGRGEFADRARFPFPCLLLLDLKLPRVSGFEVLEWICGQASMNSLRVVIVSSSGQEQDLKLAEHMGVSGYLIKPTIPNNLSCFADELKSRWLA